VANNTGHGDRTGSPYASKVEVKDVIFDIWTAMDRNLHQAISCLQQIVTLIDEKEKSKKFMYYAPFFNHPGRLGREVLTVFMVPPDKCAATAFAMAGFSATHRIFGAMVKVLAQ
jgi:hypothetical protein